MKNKKIQKSQKMFDKLFDKYDYGNYNFTMEFVGVEEDVLIYDEIDGEIDVDASSFRIDTNAGEKIATILIKHLDRLGIKVVYLEILNKKRYKKIVNNILNNKYKEKI